MRRNGDRTTFEYCSVLVGIQVSLGSLADLHCALHQRLQCGAERPLKSNKTGVKALPLSAKVPIEDPRQTIDSIHRRRRMTKMARKFHEAAEDWIKLEGAPGFYILQH
jgi:hypothetical protein